MSVESIKAQAQQFEERGYSFIIVPEGDKKSGASWSTKPASINDIKSDGDNIGLLNGSHSDGLMCVDLDTDNMQLLGLADAILPPTPMMDGRGDYLKAHRYYKIRPVYQWHDAMMPNSTSEIRKAMDSRKLGPFFGKQPFKTKAEAGADGIDFLGASGLVVCPPSLHKSGQRREWHGGEMGLPAEISFDELYDAVLRLAREWNCITVKDRRKEKQVAKERNHENKIERIQKYLSKIDGAVSGEGGNAKTFGAMASVAGGFDLTESEALAAFQEYNSRCSPAWEDYELSRMYCAAYAGYKGVYGDKLSREYGSSIDPDEFCRKMTSDKDTAISVIREYGRELAKMTKGDLSIIREYAKDHPNVAKGTFDEIIKASKASLSVDIMKEQDEQGCLNENDFLETATAFMEDLGKRLVWHGGEFFVFVLGAYARVSDDYIEKKIHDFVKNQKVFNPEGPPKDYEITKRKLSEIFNCVKNEVMVRDETEKESWLNGKTDRVINMMNGLFFVKDKELRQHDDNYFSTQQLDFNYEESAECPEWMGCLENWFNDSGSREALKTMFAYIVSKRTDAHKMFFMIGKTRAGKGTASKVLESMVGGINTCGPSIGSLTKDFGLAQLIDKSLALVGEAQLSKRDDSSGIASLLKSITGEDVMSVNRKNKDHLDVRLNVRFVFMANHIDQFPDVSGALSNRFLIIPFRSSFLGSEDLDIDDKLKSERSGIFNWLLDGLESEPFEPKEAQVERSMLNESTSPVKTFFGQSYELKGGEVYKKEDLWTEFKDWSELHDVYDYNQNNFFKEFKQIYCLKTKRIGVGKVSYYDGMSMTERAKAELALELERS